MKHITVRQKKGHSDSIEAEACPTYVVMDEALREKRALVRNGSGRLHNQLGGSLSCPVTSGDQGCERAPERRRAGVSEPIARVALDNGRPTRDNNSLRNDHGPSRTPALLSAAAEQPRSPSYPYRPPASIPNLLLLLPRPSPPPA